MKQISGKHAFITGGASGIGLAMARALLQEGALVTVADYDEQNLQSVSDAFHCVTLDVRDREQWRAAKTAAEARQGPVSILCNNAGIGPNVAELADTDPDDFDRMIAIKLTGTFNGIHSFATEMRTRREGHIVNTASMAALEINAKLGAYTASKCGVVGLSEVLRKEMEPYGIGVSVLCPGMTSTGLPISTAKADGRELPTQAMSGIDPAWVALRVIQGINGNWPYILTHGERKLAVEGRFCDIIDAFENTPHSHEL
jgi:NAD(P)-dependent dehydrogenase (short-subunit alcohol dehydrogenase family)